MVDVFSWVSSLRPACVRVQTRSRESDTLVREGDAAAAAAVHDATFTF